MKKSKILMLLPAFLLVGCAKSISKEDAVAKAKEINEYQAAHPVTEFAFELKSVEEYNGEKHEETMSYEFSEDKVYFHIKTQGVDEVFAYKSEEKYYIVNETEKQYYEYASETAKEYFDNAIKSQKENIAQMFAGYAAIDVEGLVSKYSPEGAEGVKVEYSTKGEGQLSIEISYKGEEGGMKGEISAKATWENYYPSEMIYKMEASGAGQSMKEEMSATFKYSVSPSYPNLSSGYTKLN